METGLLHEELRFLVLQPLMLALLFLSFDLFLAQMAGSAMIADRN